MSIKARPLKANCPLNNSYENVIKFDNAVQKANYFDSLENGFYESLDEQPEINFNIGDTIYTSVTLDVTKFGSTLNQALNYNYLVVKDTSFQKGFLYYFIIKSRAKNLNVVEYELELDVMTTYNINSDYTIDNFMVDRCHVNRWTKDSTKTIYKFDLSKDSLVHHSEELDSVMTSTYPSKRYKIEFGKNLVADDARELFDDINGWLVCFVNGVTLVTENDIFKEKQTNVVLPYKILIAPMKPIFFEKSTGKYYNWNAGELYEKYKSGTSIEETYSFAILKRCPIENFASGESNFTTLFKKATISNKDVLVFDFQAYQSIHSDIVTVPGRYQFNFTFDDDTNVVESQYLCIQKDKQILSNENAIYPFDYSFNNAVLGDKRDINKEPKLLKKPFTSLLIKDEDSEGFDINLFDLCKAGIDASEIKCVEVPTPEAIKDFVSFESNNSFVDKLFSTGIGFTKNNVFNLPVVDDKYKDYVRDNKLSFLTGVAVPLATSAANFAIGAATGGISLAAGGALAINQATNAGNYLANIYNLQNTPDGIKNAGNNFLQSWIKGKIDDYIEIRELRDDDKIGVYENLYRHGYSIQRRLSSANLFGRKIFNYLKSMEIVSDKIKTKNNIVLSSNIKNKISNIIQKGTCFWNLTNYLFSYDYENYEEVLINE